MFSGNYSCILTVGYKNLHCGNKQGLLSKNSLPITVLNFHNEKHPIGSDFSAILFSSTMLLFWRCGSTWQSVFTATTHIESPLTSSLRDVAHPCANIVAPDSLLVNRSAMPASRTCLGMIALSHASSVRCKSILGRVLAATCGQAMWVGVTCALQNISVFP